MTSDKPLHQFIDMEAYDVVSGDLHRLVKDQLGIAAVALGRIADGVNQDGWANLSREELTHIAREALLRMRELA